MDSSSSIMVGWAAIVATVVGPVVAVLITLFWELVRRSRDGKQTVLRTILATQGRYADPGYTWAIRQARVDFARSPKVMTPYKEYLAHIQFEPTPENAEAHGREAGRREGRLISAMLRDLGYKGLTSEEIDAYTAKGLAARERLLEEALAAIVVMARNSERNANAAEEMVRRMPGG